MKSLLSRLRSLSEAPNNFIALTPAEARVLVEAIEAGKTLAKAAGDDSLSRHEVRALDAFWEALAKLEKEAE